MKTLAEIQAVIGGEIKEFFTYSIDQKNKHLTLFLYEQPSAEQMEMLDKEGFSVEKTIYNEYTDETHTALRAVTVYEIQHKNLAEVELVTYENEIAKLPSCIRVDGGSACRYIVYFTFNGEERHVGFVDVPTLANILGNENGDFSDITARWMRTCLI